VSKLSKGARGRPRNEWRRVKRAPAQLSDGYDQAWRSSLSVSEIARQLREYAESHEGNSVVHLAGWCRAIAEAAERGEIVQTAHCALLALRELENLVNTYIEPYARMGLRKLESDKRRGRRTPEYSEDTPKK